MRKYKKKHKKYGKFKSPLEQSIFKKLPKGTQYETEKLTYILEKKYIPDFIVTTKNGRKIYIETKGYLSAKDQQKMRAVKMHNPNLDIRFIFQKLNRVQGSKMLVTEWCHRYGFPYAINKIPRGWFKDEK